MTSWTDLTVEQQTNATNIVAVARTLGASDWDCIATLMCAMQESRLVNLPAGDKDSVGLFQQRPSQGWGTPEQCGDLVWATTTFLTGSGQPGLDRWLLKLGNRTSLGYAWAIQWVQRSAFPDRYAIWESLATQIVALLNTVPVDVPPLPDPVPEPPDETPVEPVPDPSPVPDPAPIPDPPPPDETDPQEQPMVVVATGLPWIPAASYGGNFNAPPPRQVVIHSTETPLQRGIANSLARNWFGTSAAGTSAHDMFDPAAGVEMVRTSNIAWHCGTGNSTSVGIEHAGRASFSKAEWLTTDGITMLKKSAALTAKFCQAFDIPARWLSVVQVARDEKGLCTHNDMRLGRGGTTHTDPGPNFPYDEYLGWVKQALSGDAPQGDWFDFMDDKTFNAIIKRLEDKIDAIGAAGEHNEISGNLIATLGDRADKYVKGQDSDQTVSMARIKSFLVAAQKEGNEFLIGDLAGNPGATFRDRIANATITKFGAGTESPHRFLARITKFLVDLHNGVDVLDSSYSTRPKPTAPAEIEAKSTGAKK